MLLQSACHMARRCSVNFFPNFPFICLAVLFFPANRIHPAKFTDKCMEKRKKLKVTNEGQIKLR